VLTPCARAAASSADVAKAYKNLDELLAQLRSSFYTGAAGAGAGAAPAKGGQAEAAQSSRLRVDASEEAAGPRPPPPPAYEEFDDGLGEHSLLSLRKPPCAPARHGQDMSKAILLRARCLVLRCVARACMAG